MFLPKNATWLARESLKRLKQTCSVRDYVKDFSSLMLDIRTCPKKISYLTLSKFVKMVTKGTQETRNS